MGPGKPPTLPPCPKGTEELEEAFLSCRPAGPSQWPRIARRRSVMKTLQSSCDPPKEIEEGIQSGGGGGPRIAATGDGLGTGPSRGRRCRAVPTIRLGEPAPTTPKENPARHRKCPPRETTDLAARPAPGRGIAQPSATGASAPPGALQRRLPRQGVPRPALTVFPFPSLPPSSFRPRRTWAGTLPGPPAPARGGRRPRGGPLSPPPRPHTTPGRSPSLHVGAQ